MGVQGWPLLVREPEFAGVRAALIGSSQSAGVVVVGGAGVGKTTLARQVCQTLGQRVHWVAGTVSSRGIPLGAFSHFVETATIRDPMAFLAAARENLTAEPGTVLVVDDAQLLDELSATLVHQVALPRSVPMLINLEDGQPAPDAITLLWRDRYLQRLDLGPLSRGQCVELIEQALGGLLEELSADLMWQDSGGNPLLLRHLVEGAVEAGTLRQARGVWQLRGRASISAELAAVVGQRLEQLPEPVVHTVGLLALCEPLDLDLLTSLVGSAAVEQAEARGLIRIIEDRAVAEVRLNQVLLGEATRGRLGLAGARRLRGELVRALADKPIRGPAERIRLADLTLNSDASAGVGLLMAAADDAIALTNVTLGERLARAAVDSGGGPAASELLARSLLWQGKTSEAESTLKTLDPDAMNEIELLRWGTVRMINLQLSIGDTQAAQHVLQLLRDRITTRELRPVVDGLAAASLSTANQLDEALEFSYRVLGNSAAPANAVGWAVYGGGLALALMGRGNETAALADRGRAVEQDVGVVLQQMMAYPRIWALVSMGEFDAATSRSASSLQISSPNQYLGWGIANGLAANVELARGHFAAAVSRLEQTVAAVTTESSAWWGVPRMLLAQAYCGLGRADSARTIISELQSRSGTHDTVFRPQLRIVEAWLAAATGNSSGAVQIARDAADLAQRCGQRAVEMMALHDAARFGDSTGLQRLITVASTVAGDLAPRYGAYAAALADRDPVALSAAGKQFEQIGAMLAAADAAAQASRMFAVHGKTRQAAEAAARARSIADAAGGMHTPALLAAAQPLPLTPREREVAYLVAAGLTSREIAEQLTVSIRTVEQHIYHSCTKLGVADRKALAEFVHPPPRA